MSADTKMIKGQLSFKISALLTGLLSVFTARIKEAVCFVAIESRTGLVGGNCAKDRSSVGRRNLEVVCQGKAWISSFSPIPGVYGNSNGAYILMFRHQNSVKVRNIMISA